MIVFEKDVFLLKEELNDAGISPENYFALEYRGKDKEIELIVKLLKEKLTTTAKRKIAGKITFPEAITSIESCFREFWSLNEESICDSRFYESGIVSYTRKQFTQIIKTIYNFIVLTHKSKEEFDKMLDMIQADYHDFNGLKAINDFAGKENGTNYLKAGVRIISGASKFLEENGCKGLFFTFGGDEFVLLRMGYCKEFIKDFFAHQDMQISAIDTSRLINFKQKKIIEKFLQGGVKVPANAKLIPAIARGSASLLEAIISVNKDKEISEMIAYLRNNRKEEQIFDKRYARVLKTFIGLMEKNCGINKDLYYQKMSESNNPVSRFQVVLRMRNEEASRIAQENFELKEKLKKILFEMAELKEKNSVLKKEKMALEKKAEYLRWKIWSE